MSSPLREALFLAAKSGDWQAMYELCRENADAIRKNFVHWKRVPEDVRADESKVEEYVQTLFAVADFFSKELSDDSLQASLTGQPEDNPLGDVGNQLAQARQLMARAEYDEALRVVQDVLEQLSGLEGPGTRHYLAIAYGCTGEAYFHSGSPTDAIEPFHRALTLCDANQDLEGIGAYLGSLHEVHRYLGRLEESGGYAERLATLLQGANHPGADHYRKRAQQVREGQPLNRVVLQTEAGTFELDEEIDQPPDDRFRFNFERNRLTLGGCLIWVERGRSLASSAKYADAIDCFQLAARIDPYAPDPHYNLALALLDSGSAEDAVDEYKKTEELAPGWYHCRGDLWLAEQIAAGLMEHRTFQLIRRLQDAPDEPAEKVELAKEAVATERSIAVLWLLLGENLHHIGQLSEAEESFQTGLRCVSNVGHRTRLLTALGAVTKDDDLRRTALAEAIQLNGNLVAAAMARVLL